MVLMFEIAGPFRWKPKAENYGPLHRLIWGWFSVAYIASGFNDVSRAIREDERLECAKVCDDYAQSHARGEDEYKAQAWMMRQCGVRIRARSN